MEKEKKDFLDMLIEDPNASNRNKNIAAVILEDKDGEIAYRSVELESYDEKKIRRYLYKRGPEIGLDFSPTSRITEPEKTLKRKFFAWFEKSDKVEEFISEEEKKWLARIQKVIAENKEMIRKEVEELFKNVPKKEGMFITLKIMRDGKSFYPGDIEAFCNIMKKRSQKELEAKAAAKDKVCAICGEKKEQILSNASVYTFYTEDKIGYITGGFDKKRSWRNYPVCPKCWDAMVEGRRYVEKNLAFRFCGLPYYLIPKFIMGHQNTSEEILDIFTDTSRLFSLKEKVKTKITVDEKDILYYLKDANDVLTLNFLFLRKENKAERIVLLIEDVFPSYLREIFSAKEKVDEKLSVNFTFGSIRTFFAKSDPAKRNNDLDKYFLDTLHRIFKKRPVDKKFIFRFIMQRLRSDLVYGTRDNFFFSSRDGLAVLLFLNEMKLVKLEVKEMCDDGLFEKYFQKYDKTFGLPAQKGLFLLGALTELLLRKQYSSRESKPPFLKNLKNLKMSERDFKGLLPKVQNKLEEYASFDIYKKKLAGEIAYYLLQAGDNWEMSIDEMNFYFAAGMNRVGDVANIIFPDKEKVKEEISEEGELESAANN